MAANKPIRVSVTGHCLVIGSQPEASRIDPLVLLQGRMTGAIPAPVQPMSLEVQTGIYSGVVDVTVEVCSVGPEDLASGWEDIEEYPLRAEQGEIVVAGFESLPIVVGVLDNGPMDYRVRVHAVGRDADFDLAVEESSERYLVYMWPERPRSKKRLRAGSRAGSLGF
ncbi:hypothetical protein [Arthrobacter sp. HY1533]|uniref:hypothetical protein n=1 Tax=Arthrobacter sp. HY1533 TaxID=2970919 RepID=UPI0022B9E2FD|nr:hypothetical protein [Arthrobacter sp. HY1533]